MINQSLYQKPDFSMISNITPMKHQISLSFIDTYCRIRSSPPNTISVINSNSQQNTITLSKQDCDTKTFQFFKVFDQTKSHHKIVRTLAEKVMENVLYERKDVVFFNYGTINSGKTFTTIGTIQQPGLLRCILKIIKSDIQLHAIEIIDNQCFNLTSQRQNITSFDSPFQTKNKVDITPQSQKEILNSLILNRTTFNSTNSLSHAVFKIHFAMRTITIFDLAGGYASNQSPGIHKSLNKDLFFIKNALTNSLQSTSKSYVSKLLKNQITDDTKVIMLINLFDSQQLIEETEKILQLSSSLKNCEYASTNFQSLLHSNSNDKIEKESNDKILQQYEQILLPEQVEKNQLIKNILFENIHIGSDLKSIENNVEDLDHLLEDLNFGVVIEECQDEEIQAFRSSFKNMIELANQSEVDTNEYKKRESDLIQNLTELYRSTNKTITQLQDLKKQKGLIQNLQLRQQYFKTQLKESENKISQLTRQLLDLKQHIRLISNKRQYVDVACSPFKIIMEDKQVQAHQQKPVTVQIQIQTENIQRLSSTKKNQQKSEIKIIEKSLEKQQNTKQYITQNSVLQIPVQKAQMIQNGQQINPNKQLQQKPPQIEELKQIPIKQKVKRTKKPRGNNRQSQTNSASSNSKQPQSLISKQDDNDSSNLSQSLQLSFNNGHDFTFMQHDDVINDSDSKQDLINELEPKKKSNKNRKSNRHVSFSKQILDQKSPAKDKRKKNKRTKG